MKSAKEKMGKRKPSAIVSRRALLNGLDGYNNHRVSFWEYLSLQPKRFRLAAIGGSISLTLSFASMAFGIMYYSNWRLSKDNHTNAKRIISLEEEVREKEQTIANLQALNSEIINPLYNILEGYERKMPGSGGLFFDTKLFIDDVVRFNDKPESIKELDRIKKQFDLYPDTLDGIQFNYIYKEHGLPNYIPAIPTLMPPFVDNNKTIVKSEFGMRKHIHYINKGKEEYLGTWHHDGYDLWNPDRRLIDKENDWEVKFQRDYHELPNNDSRKLEYGNRGRMLIIERHIVVKGVDYGYYRAFLGHLDQNSNIIWNPGDIIRKGEVMAYMGNSGTFSTGPHLHWEVYYSKTGKQNTWKLIDAFANKIYAPGKNVVYYFDWNLPASLRK